MRSASVRRCCQNYLALSSSARKLGDKNADEVATFGEIVTEFTIEKRYDVEEVDADEQEQDEACVEYDDDLYHLD